MSDQECEEQVDRDAPKSRNPAAQDRRHVGGELVERLTDRLMHTTAFVDEWIRQRELEKPRPDYGTFLKDAELL